MTVNCGFFHLTFASFAVQAEWCSPNEQLFRMCFFPVCLLWDKTTCSIGLLFGEKICFVITRCCYLICLINLRKYLQLFYLVGIWCEGWISYMGIFVLACGSGKSWITCAHLNCFTVRCKCAYRPLSKYSSLVLLQTIWISRVLIKWRKVAAFFRFCWIVVLKEYILKAPLSEFCCNSPPSKYIHELHNTSISFSAGSLTNMVKIM